MTTSMETQETAQGAASATDHPEATKKATARAQKPRVAPAKGKASQKTTPARKGARAAKKAPKTPATKPEGVRKGSKTERAHPHHLPRCFDSLARRLRFFQHIGERLFHVAVLARLYDLRAELGVLEVAGRDHDAVDVRPRQHLFGVLENERFRTEQVLYLLRATFACEAPDVAYRSYFHGRALRCQVDHVDMATPATPASELCNTDAVVRSQYLRVRSCCECCCRSGQLQKLSAAGFAFGIWTCHVPQFTPRVSDPAPQDISFTGAAC